MLAGIREVIGGDAELIGCSATGEFTERAVTNDGVAVALVASDTRQFFTGLGTGLGENVSGAVREAVADLPSGVDGYPYLSAINLHDGLKGGGEKLALVTQQKLGPNVSFVGGSASDNYNLAATHVFRNGTVVEDAVALALIASKRRPIITVDHGHEPISDPVEVTDAEGCVVRELDGRPAYEVWKDAVRERVREEFGVDVDELDTDDLALTKVMGEFEFGIDQGRAYKIRWPRVEVMESGALHFAVEIPEGTVFRVMHGTGEKQIESAREASREAMENAEGTEIAGAFVYDCACREIILGDEFPAAVDAIDEELGVPFSGFETYGEMCMQMGQLSGFHNTTTVLMLLPE